MRRIGWEVAGITDLVKTIGGETRFGSLETKNGL